MQAVLLAWHERQLGRHLAELEEVSRRPGSAAERLASVLEACARLSAHGSGADPGAVLHQGEHVARARHRLRDFLAGLIAEGAAAGDLRDDVGPGELAVYCLHALGAAAELAGPAAVRRLVEVTVTGLRPPAG